MARATDVSLEKACGAWPWFLQIQLLVELVRYVHLPSPAKWVDLRPSARDAEKASYAVCKALGLAAASTSSQWSLSCAVSLEPASSRAETLARSTDKGHLAPRSTRRNVRRLVRDDNQLLKIATS